jgi:hypothetical protein
MKDLRLGKSGQAAVELAIFGSLILLAFSVLLMYGQRLDNQQQVKMETFRRALQKAYERNGSVSYTLKKEGRSFNLFSGFGQGQASTVGSTATVMWQKGMPGNQADSDDSDYGDRSESFAYNAINDTEIGSADERGLPRYPKRIINISGREATSWVTPSIYKEDQVRSEVYSSSVQKEESPSGGIVNTRVSDLRETVTTTPYVRIDLAETDASEPHNVPLPEYVYEGESYNPRDEPVQTVVPITPVQLGAYYVEDSEDDTKDNRIDYSPDKVGTNIHRERSWQTDY